QMSELWGTEALVWFLVPSRAGDERFRRWHASPQRAMTSPGALQAYMRALYDVDARPVLSSIQAPTLVLHRKDAALAPLEQGRYLAEHIEGARLVELEGSDAALIYEGGDLVADLIEEFMTGERRGGRADRVLATVLFTDIVGSTEQAAELGDERWREVLDAHDDAAAGCVEQYGGQLIKTTGDGIMATFDGPGRGIRCGLALRDGLRGIGTQVRVGLHTGEIELRRGDIGGMTVHIAARVMGEASPGEVRLTWRRRRAQALGQGCLRCRAVSVPTVGKEGSIGPAADPCRNPRRFRGAEGSAGNRPVDPDPGVCAGRTRTVRPEHCERRRRV